MDREESFTIFKTLVNKYQNVSSLIHTANEATTRLLLIDEILILLGWKKEDFNPEYNCQQAGFADYALSINKIPRVIVEAKRIGVTFGFPQRKFTQNEYAVSYFKSAFRKELTDIIMQAQGYCVNQGVPYAAITNGSEWMVLPMLPKVGKTIESMKGIYFGNIFSEDFSFDLFWQLLSKTSVENNSLENYLSDINYSPSEVCRILKLDYGDLQWIYHKNEQYLDDFYENFFSQITDSTRRKMLEYCFVSDSKLNQFKGELKRVLKDNLPRFLPNKSLDLTPEESKKQILTEDNIGKVVIITGSVGCGKSTLVTKCLVEAKQEKGQYATPLLLDLINEVSKQSINVKEVVFKYLYEKLKENYPKEFEIEQLKKTFSGDLKVLKSGAYSEIFREDEKQFKLKEAEKLDELQSDHEKMVISTFKRQTNENKSVIIILDNVDRASESFQEEIYAISHKLSQETGASIIITLREFTFFKNRDRGFLDVRPEDKVIHLKAPDFSKLIATRIRYIQNHLNEDYRLREWRKRYNIEQFKKAMFKHADTLKNNLQISSNGNSILGMLAAISWHNIRLFYQLIKRVHCQLGSSSQNWNKEEIIASLMSNLEQDEQPYLPNVFQPYQNINQCYFLKLRILLFLHDAIKEVVQGVPLERVKRFCLLYGYKSEWIYRIIEESIKERLIECLELPSDSDYNKNYQYDPKQTVRISPLGVSLILDISFNSIYVSLIALNLPFHEIQPFDELKQNYELVSSYMSDDRESKISRDGIDIILKSDLAKISSNYIIKEYEKEKLSLNQLKNQTEVYITEDKLSNIIKLLNNLADNVKSYRKSKKDCVEQFCLELDLDCLEKEHNKKIISVSKIIPPNFELLTQNSSEYLVLIFIALVIQTSKNIECSSGIELTKIINKYLVASDNQKYPNNVSRALRSEKLKNQGWLLIRSDMHHKFKKFALSDCWKDHWIEIFQITPPDI